MVDNQESVEKAVDFLLVVFLSDGLSLVPGDCYEVIEGRFDYMAQR